MNCKVAIFFWIRQVLIALFFLQIFLIRLNNKKKEVVNFLFCGAYETRTRDPMRDRHVF